MADDPRGIESFSEFRRSLSSSRYAELMAKPGTKIESADAFEEMRTYLLDLYEGVDARHSFVDSGGLIVDSIPFDQQPAVRNSKRSLSLPSPEELAPSASLPSADEKASEKAPPQLHPDYKDKFGNQMFCPEGTVPMVRVTLDQMSQFRTLHDFLQHPADGEHLPGQAALLEADQYTYEYLAAAYQDVRNFGGYSTLSAHQSSLPCSSGVMCRTKGDRWYTQQGIYCGWRRRNDGLPYLEAFRLRGHEVIHPDHPDWDFKPIRDNRSRVQLWHPWSPQEVGMGFERRTFGWALLVNRDPIGYFPITSNFPQTEWEAIQFGGKIDRNGKGYQKDIKYLADYWDDDRNLTEYWYDCDLNYDRVKVDNSRFNEIKIRGTRIDFWSPTFVPAA